MSQAITNTFLIDTIYNLNGTSVGFIRIITQTKQRL